MASKTYKIEFFVGSIHSDDDAPPQVSDLLSNLVADGAPPIKSFGAHSVQLRDLQAFNNGASFRGVLAKYRTDDLPHIAAPDEPERNIELEEDEGLIEKNHLLYFRNRQLLVYQGNYHGSRVGALEFYLGDAANTVVTFDPIVQGDALQRLMAGDAQPRRIEVSFARPDPAAWANVNKHPFSAHLVELMSQTGGHRVHVTITPPRKGVLHQSVKQALRRLVGSDVLDVNIARTFIEQDGVEYPIDLIADRLIVAKEVRMSGRYPAPDSMYSALREAYEEHRPAIDEILRGDN